MTLVLAMIIFEMTAKARATEINKWNYIKLKSFCAAKETVKTIENIGRRPE